MKQFVFIRNFRPFPLLCAAAMLICCLCALPAFAHINETAAVKSGETLKGKIIAVDPGHGGADPGAVGVTGTVEKEINLILSKKLEKLLKAKGATVIMTRTEDSVYSEIKKEELDHRIAMVEKGKADLFLSVQCNAVPNNALRGAQSFYYPDSKDGELLAGAIQQSLINTLKNTDREALTLNSAYILGNLKIPAVIVEVGFLSHPEEEALLKDDAYQEKIVAGIYKGILDYYDKKNSAASWFRALVDHLDA